MVFFPELTPGREAALTPGMGPLAPAGSSGQNFLLENTLSAMVSSDSGVNGRRPPRSVLLTAFTFNAHHARFRRTGRLSFQ